MKQTQAWKILQRIIVTVAEWRFPSDYIPSDPTTFTTANRGLSHHYSTSRNHNETGWSPQRYQGFPKNGKLQRRVSGGKP